MKSRFFLTAVATMTINSMGFGITPIYEFTNDANCKVQVSQYGSEIVISAGNGDNQVQVNLNSDIKQSSLNTYCRDFPHTGYVKDRITHVQVDCGRESGAASTDLHKRGEDFAMSFFRFNGYHSHTYFGTRVDDSFVCENLSLSSIRD